MLRESDRRAADLAVSRFGVSRDRLQQVVELLDAEGRQLDLLDALLHNDLITDDQVQEIRLLLGRTLFDPKSPKNKRNGNGKAAKDIFNAPTLPPETSLAEADAAANVELSRLGDCKILRRLGEGGMGAVYLAYRESEKMQVAIKVLSPKHCTNQAAIDRFYREAKSGALLKHANIVRILASGQDQATGLHYLIMEYVDGPSLDTLLEKKGKLSVADAVYIVLDIARGLEHVHSRNIVHRDIKPGNILITQSGLAKLSDLGLAKRTDEASHLTAARQGFGTPYYMPYEQAVNAKAADSRSDIYALGATLYQLLLGEVPFTGTSPVEIVEKKHRGEYIPVSTADPTLPKILDALLARMLAREPRHRYQTASELIVDLERSQLAASVPSFVDPDRAMHDPVVRQRIASSMEVTAMQVPSNSDTPIETQYWYVRFRDENDQWRKVKLSVSQIINRFQQGKFPRSAEVCPYANGDFRPLRAYTEFQKLAEPVKKKKPVKKAVKKAVDAAAEEIGDDGSNAGNSAWLWVAGATALAVIAVAAVMLVMLFRNW